MFPVDFFLEAIRKYIRVKAVIVTRRVLVIGLIPTAWLLLSETSSTTARFLMWLLLVYASAVLFGLDQH